MLAWRLCQDGYADLAGFGARRYGGRWNRPGRAMVYAASSAALAVFEVRVHLDLAPELIPDDYLLLTLDFDGLAVEVVDEMPEDPAAYGDAWLSEGRTPLLEVPSAIVPESTNLLLNPVHPEATPAHLIQQRPFRFDRRLWAPLGKAMRP